MRGERSQDLDLPARQRDLFLRLAQRGGEVMLASSDTIAEGIAEE